VEDQDARLPDDGSRIESSQPLVLVNQRAVNQFDSFLLLGRQPVVTQSLHCPLERLHRNVQADEALKLLVVQELPEQPPFTAPQVEDATSAAGS
jgi:hypothetical protein